MIYAASQGKRSSGMTLLEVIIAVAILTLDNDIADVHADAHIDAPVVRQPLIAPRHLTLKSRRALDCVDHAAKLGEQTVAHKLENTAVMLGDLRLEQLFSVRTQAVERVRLVL